MQLIAVKAIEGWTEGPGKSFENLKIETVYINPASVASVTKNDDITGTEYTISDIYLNTPRYVSFTATEMEEDGMVDLTYRYLTIEPITDIVEKINNALLK